jgi:hypothetical protein
MDTLDLWLWVWLGLLIGLFFGALLLAGWTDKRRPMQRDWVAERHRRITRRGFKTRAGIR